MKIKFLIALACLVAGQVFSQEYFQQEVNYKINVTLDDKAHTISGDIEIEYISHAPQPLDSIWVHLWGNAFSEPTTAFGEQKLRMGSTEFYFAKDSDRGYYSGLDFSIDGEKATWVFDKKNPDIAVIRLAKPLKTNEKITIRTPFTLKIPDSFSRLGHVGESYQMTQWYPKPAVFDHKGWHPMPYLDMGEFYSEFGSFDVTITLPENYVVGATGTLQTESERRFLTQKVTETEALMKSGFSESTDFPASSPTMKTIRYTAEDVHDFAWFADKRFHVLKNVATLASGRQVDAWAMFTNVEADLWTKGADYVKRAVEFYSEHVGEYPWPHATAVQSALSAGAGMEYPMITVIGRSGNARALDDVITHEVGHNWFYGLLASNERDHAWMDEGMNSYYEYRYMENYYGSRVPLQLPGFITKSTDSDLYELAYLFQCRRSLDQAPETTSNDFSSVNYGLSAYAKPGSAFIHLEQYLGTERFDEIMQSYFEKWKFKHPYPEDLRKHFETESGKDLSWFFDGYLFSKKKLDYSMAGIETASQPDPETGERDFKLLIKNKGEITAPFPVAGYKHSEWVKTEWFEGFAGEQEVSFPACDCDAFVIDGHHVTLDYFRKNNNIKTSGLIKTGEPFRLRMLGALENSRQTNLNFFPIAGANSYDGFMAGLLLHNGLVPARKFEYQVAATYGFGSKDIVGMTGFRYNIFPESEKVRKVQLGFTTKTFNFVELDSLQTEAGFESTLLQYWRLVPFLRVELMRSPTSKFYQIIQYRNIMRVHENADFRQDSTRFYTGNSRHGAVIHELTWELGNKRVINPYSLLLAFEQRKYEDPFGGEDLSYVRASLEYKSAYTYEKDKQVDFRVFVGGFLQNSARNRGFIAPGAYNLTGQGFNDYRFDELYFGRSETSGLLSQQIYEREGGMKIPLGSPYSEGRSNSFLFAVNLKADLPQDLPGKLPLRPYFDLGYYADQRPISSDLSFSDQVWWQGGIAVEVAKGMLGVYVPVVNSKNVKDLYNQSGRSGFFERIAFSIKLTGLSPWKLTDELEF